jgi:hypothetical protein
MKIFISHDHVDGGSFAAGLAEALAGRGHEAVGLDSLNTDSRGTLSAAIGAEIRTSDLVVALLTANSRPNVYFELGLAAGAGVPTVVAATGTEQLTADLASAQYIALTGELVIDVTAVVRRVLDIGAGARVPATVTGGEPSRTAMGIQRHPSEVLATAALDPTVLESLSPVEFERLVAELFRERGFQVVDQDGPGDNGVDLIISGDPVTVVQVKRYRRENLVPVRAVRDVLAAMSYVGAERAILVSSSAFTRSARAIAAELPIDLMTIDDLLAMPAADARGSGGS